MQEYVFKTEIDDIRLCAIVFDEAFRIKNSRELPVAMSNLKSIHEHASYEIFFVFDGTLRVITENTTKEYRDSIVIIPPHFQHYTNAEDASGYCMYFAPEPLRRKQDGLYERLRAALGDGVLALEPDEESRFYIRRLEKSAEDGLLWENGEPLTKLLFSSLFRRIVPQKPSQNPTRGKHAKYSNAIDSYLAWHYSEKIRLEDLAAELFLCRKQVTRIIQREYGCSLADLVNRHRLAVACMLLKHTDLDIGEIACNVGYEHGNYFYTLFRKTYGVTPRGYREQSRTEKDGEPIASVSH